MTRFFSASTFLLLLCGPVTAQEVEQPSLWPVELRRVDPEHSVLHQIPVTVVVMKQRQVRRTYVVGTQKKTVTVTECTPQQEQRWVQWTLQDFQVLDAKGTPLAPQQIWERFREGMDVYRASTPAVGPELLGRLPEDALIIVPRPSVR